MTGSGNGRDDGYPSAPTSPFTSPTPASEEGDGSPGGSDPCNFMQRAPLNSPQPAIIARISVGDILGVVLNASGARPVLEVHAPSGVAGALTHRGHLAIINCIQSGRAYRAVVLKKSGGAVEVRVEPA